MHHAITKKHAPELCLDPSFGNSLPTSSPTPRRKKRWLITLFALGVGCGFVGGTLAGALIGAFEHDRKIVELRHAIDVQSELDAQLKDNLEFWRGQALSCMDYSRPQRPIPERSL